MPNRADSAKIHMAKKALAMSDSQYRDLLRDRYGVESSKDLSAADTADLLGFFRQQGWEARPPREAEQAQPPAPRRPAPRKNVAAMVAKIAVQLRDAGRLGKGVDRLAYADGIARHMFFKGHPEVQVWVEWLEPGQLVKVIQALEIDAKRRVRRLDDAQPVE
ncbi:MAG: regulatory protein GemA [Magnetococcales bacterium]|nr:regulatory protein GemA [Magnetococcales bacterium]